MKIYELKKYPDVTNRRRIWPNSLHYGSIVAFRKWQCEKERTGIIVMEYENWMIVAINLYKEEGRVWYSDELPNDIELYEATEDEILCGLSYFLNYDTEVEGSIEAHPLISLIRTHCKEDAYVPFCREALIRVEYFTDEAERRELKHDISQLIMQSSGLQYDRCLVENYCFLLGVIMIVNTENDKYRRTELIKTFRDNWGHFSWMYGLGLGRVLGSKLNNITSVINQTTQNDRKYYLHLYLPLAEFFIDKIGKYTNEKPEKLRRAIERARIVEAREKQETNLDALYGILFPNHSLEALRSSRPAGTIEEMRQELVARDQKISALESRLSESISNFNHRYESLLHSFEALAKASITFDEIKKGLGELSRTTAEGVLEKLSITLADNKMFMDELPKLREFVKSNETPKVIHNNFAPGSQNQVFNDRVDGKFK